MNCHRLTILTWSLAGIQISNLLHSRLLMIPFAWLWGSADILRHPPSIVYSVCLCVSGCVCVCVFVWSWFLAACRTATVDEKAKNAAGILACLAFPIISKPNWLDCTHAPIYFSPLFVWFSISPFSHLAFSGGVLSFLFKQPSSSSSSSRHLWSSTICFRESRLVSGGRSNQWSLFIARRCCSSYET